MAYRLLHIDSGTSLTLTEEYWHEILKKAEDSGWEPEGTLFDLDFVLDESLEESTGSAGRLYASIVSHNELREWNGSYTEKENQIITESDAYYMFQALEEVTEDPLLFELLCLGALRICDCQ